MIMYFKIINDRPVFSACKTIQMPNGQWVSNPSQEQIAEAGWRVVVPPERTLEVAKREMVSALEAYDQSDAVLSFSLYGRDMWINPTERTNYLMTVNAAESMGLSTVPFHGMRVTTNDAKGILNAVALYAMQVMAVTDAHLDAINALATIEEVDAYDFKTGYPTKLSF